jgi:hypothetical protein
MSSILKIDWATHEAAKFACENWHYTGKMPVNKLVKIGVWENEIFIGVVIFGGGASATLHNQFNVTRFEVCELVRIALTKHLTPVSRIIKIALKFLKKTNPLLKVCVSFADPSAGHHGGVYQAGGWIYTGMSEPVIQWFFNNGWRHNTDACKRLSLEKRKKLPKRFKSGKHRYVFPFDPIIKKKVELIAKPYPKRAESIVVDAPAIHAGEGGAEPTSALHFKK